MSDKVKKFRVWPDNDFLFFRVFIHPTKKAMFASTHKPHIHEAICQNFDRWFVPKEGPPVFSGEIGELHFYRGSFKAGILAHEMSHATYGYFAWRKKHAPIQFGRARRGYVENEEEAFCWVIGNLYRQAAISQEGREYRPRFKAHRFIPRISRRQMRKLKLG